MDNVNLSDDALDRQLRETAPYIEDAGFTAGVLKLLPEPRAKSQRARPFILVGMSALASLLAYFLSDGGRFLLVEVTRLSVLPPLWLLAMTLGTGIVVMTGGLVAATSKALQVQS
jgi:hypothetical protein